VDREIQAVDAEDSLSTDDLRDLLLSARPGGRSVLSEAFDRDRRVMKIRASVHVRVGDWYSKVKRFRETDSLFRRVLNKLFQHILNVPAMDNAGSLSTKALTDVLTKLFSPATLRVHDFIETALGAEVDRLYVEMTSELESMLNDRTRSNIVKACCVFIANTTHMHGETDIKAWETDLKKRCASLLLCPTVVWRWVVARWRDS